MALLSLLLVVSSSLMVSGRARWPAGILEAALAVAKNGEIDRHADPDVDDVGLEIRAFHRHGVELGNLEQGRGALAGVEGLPLLHRHGHHGTGEGGPGSGIPQVDPGCVHRDLGLHPLGVEGPDIGQGSRPGSPWRCPRSAVLPRPLATICRWRWYARRALRRVASLESSWAWSCRAGPGGILEGVLLGQIVDLDQQLPCLTSRPRVTCSFLIWPDTWAPTLTCLRAFRVPSAMMSCSRSPDLCAGGDVVGGCLGLGRQASNRARAHRGSSQKRRGENVGMTTCILNDDHGGTHPEPG